jgi:chaperonin GroES
MTVTPLNDKVLVKKHTPSEMTAGGIFIPEVCREDNQLATVVELGQGRLTDEGIRLPFEVEVGDIVLIPKFTGLDLKEIEENLLLIREADIMSVVGRVEEN